LEKEVSRLAMYLRGVEDAAPYITPCGQARLTKRLKNEIISCEFYDKER